MVAYGSVCHFSRFYGLQVLLTIAGISGFALSSWSIDRQQSVWIIFLISSCLMVLVIGLHVAVHYANSKDRQDLRGEGNSVSSGFPLRNNELIT